MVYSLALAAAALVYRLTAGSGLFVRVLAADTAATVLVYFAGLVLSNASVYDPYWSVAPLVILPGVLLEGGPLSAGDLLMLAVVALWGIRLTANWAYTFSGLAHQDWRYDMLRRKTGRFYSLVSFVGIHYIPTLVVYLAMLPAVAYVESGGALRPLTVVGFLICVAAVLLQATADRQMHRFRRAAGRGELIRVGLWKHARHPNYLGEILMWWGVWLAMASVLPAQWHLIAGAVANTLLFLCISIPMADARYRREKPGYEQYRRETRMLLPLPRRSRPAKTTE